MAISRSAAESLLDRVGSLILAGPEHASPIELVQSFVRAGATMMHAEHNMDAVFGVVGLGCWFPG